MVEGSNQKSKTEQTAVAQLLRHGVPKEKLIIGKPISGDEELGFAKNGFVEPETLQDWACDVKEEYYLFDNWNSGFMAWQYVANSTLNMDFGFGVSGEC